MITEALVFSYDDEIGLRNLMPVILSSGFDQVVVAYGSSDPGSYRFLEQYSDRVTLVREDRRLGKPSAFNAARNFLKGDILFMMSSDIRVFSFEVKRTLSLFNGNIGAVVPPVVPTERPGIVNKTGELLWHIRDSFLRIISRKGDGVHGGELLIFRTDLIKEIPHVVNDEEYICMEIRCSGYKVVFSEYPLVRNLVPDNARDYIIQRERVIFGHKQMKRFGFNPKVLDFLALEDPVNFFSSILTAMFSKPKLAIYIFPLVYLELISILRSKTYSKRSNPVIWKFADSTKQRD